MAAACSAGGDGGVFDGNSGGAGGGGGAGGTGNAASGGMGGMINITTGNGGTGNMGTTCDTDPAVDDDMDGFTDDQGDCNDCDPNVNPGAIEVMITEPDENGMVPEPADEDCDLMIDNVAPPCDTGLALDDADPMNGARTVELCQAVGDNGKDWGVVSAQWVRANGTTTGIVPTKYGIQTTFGTNVNPQGGERLLALSSGQARTPGQAGACNTYLCSAGGPGTAPAGFPQDIPGCPGGQAINDDIGLEVSIKAPTNATGYSFNFKFYSFEYEEWVCDFYNDQFISLVTPPPMGSINGNISFDSMANPVSVNVAFFDVCPGCPLGIAEMAGTGFDDVWGDDAGGTGWLATSAPITGGETFSIRWAIWDTQDDVWDSTALVDNFEWVASGGTVVVGTEPVPTPK